MRERIRFRQPVALVLAWLLICPAGQAQQPAGPAGASDLAARNLNRVAASATQIQEVLRKDPGLFVELKRWVAKEATDRGQIVQDTELTDQGIINRLETDMEFRAVATRMLQRYGYLLPKLNPESEAAKERDALFQEHLKRLQKAAAEEPGPSSEANVEKATTPEPGRDQQGIDQERRKLERRREQLYTADLARQEDLFDLWNRSSLRQSLGNPMEDSELRRGLVQTGAEGGLGLSGRSMDPFAALGTAGSTSADLSSTASLQPSAALPGVEPAPPRRTRSSAALAGKEGQPSTASLESRPNPYADIPSLYDMYFQVSSRPPLPKRFGTDVFQNGISDPELLPMDLPVGPDYVVGPGDALAIDLWGSVSRRLYRMVDREGRLALPEVGPVLVSGKTMAEVQQAVQQTLRTQFRDVSADVSLSRLRTIRVYVVGDVEHPGAYDISSLSTPLNALFSAGGPTTRGSLRTLRHMRGQQLVEEVDVYDLILRGVRSDLKRLENGDTVMVPPIGPQVTIEGMVRRPAIYELRSEKALGDVLELAGGILPTALLRNIQVQRVEANQKRTMVSIAVPEENDPEAMSKQLAAFAIHDGDDVRIFPIAPQNQDAIYLQGHVLRPGRYTYRAGMKITDLISSQTDLLPEPSSKYAEIIRLNAPDYRPSVEGFDLGVALANPASAPALQPMDTVRIFGRYDFEDPPTVWVGGEVRHPGSYRTPGQMHLRDALQLAGGVTPDALMEDAQIFRHLPGSKLQILNAKLDRALVGDPAANILLQPRDHVLVQRNLGKADPPSVYVKGEVAKPGVYPLVTNMRVGDLIRLAGGLKRSAYPESADLTRYLANDSNQRVGEHQEISIAKALAGDAENDLALRDGDTLTVRQVSGWNDIGAFVVVRGEVQHPGVYAIREGERLSSVLQRAGGFTPSAYPQAALLQRAEIRELQEKSKQELIQRIEQDAANVRVSFNSSAGEQVFLQQAAVQQRERVVQKLRETPVSGRLVIKLRSNLAEFEKSQNDIEVRSGDTLLVPKRPDFVVVTGQVYNSNAITFTPRKNAGWYLRQAGGPTDLADRKAIFIVRANGSVVSGKDEGWWGGSVLSTRVEPGDTIVVPEKPIGGTTFWRNLLSVAQLAQSASIAAAVVFK